MENPEASHNPETERQPLFQNCTTLNAIAAKLFELHRTDQAVVGTHQSYSAESLLRMLDNVRLVIESASRSQNINMESISELSQITRAEGLRAAFTAAMRARMNEIEVKPLTFRADVGYDLFNPLQDTLYELEVGRKNNPELQANIERKMQREAIVDKIASYLDVDAQSETGRQAIARELHYIANHRS